MAKAQRRFPRKQGHTARHGRTVVATAVLVLVGFMVLYWTTNHPLENDEYDLSLLLSSSGNNQSIVPASASFRQGSTSPEDTAQETHPHSLTAIQHLDPLNNPLLNDLPNDPPSMPLATTTLDGGTCTRIKTTATTPTTHSWSYARIIVFQRDGGLKLLAFLKHYLQVLDPSSIVMINHQGNDPYTQKVLTAYATQGVHVWNCDGPWQNKALMWSAVTRAYGPSSRFVFPLDLDEYLVTFQKNASYHGFAWTPTALYNALHTLPQDSKGRPFKLSMYDPIPRDCVASYQHNSKNLEMDHSSSCRLKFIESDTHKCLLKTFSRGSDFVGTDTGNHFGGTKLHPNHTEIKETCFAEKNALFFKKVFKRAPNLALLHLSEVTFEDWLTHILRGAGDYAFNQETAECKGNGNHYCTMWQKIHSMQFDMWKMRGYYRKTKCIPSIELKEKSTVEWNLPGCV